MPDKCRAIRLYTQLCVELSQGKHDTINPIVANYAMELINSSVRFNEEISTVLFVGLFYRELCN